MSLDAMKQALSAIEFADMYIKEIVTGSTNRIVAENLLRESGKSLRAAIEQAQTAPAKGGLAEKVPATGTHLETIVRKAFDQIYAEQDLERWADQEPVAWVNPKWLNPKTRHWTNDTILHKPIAGWIPLYTAPRQWQGLTDEDKVEILRANGEAAVLILTEAKLREKNT